MGERKVLNKYYPPDFDPAKIPRAQRPKNQQIKVRMMLPMSIRCNTCGTYIYKGTKFNSRKEDVVGDTYLGIQIFRFYFKCTKCSAELTMKTDPQNSDYVVESGAARNYEPWRATDEAVEIEKRKREAEEMGDAMKSLENRAQDSKQDMDIMASLEEMRSLKSRHATVSIDDVLATLHHIKQEKEQKMMDEIDKADEEVIKSIVFPGHKEYVRRIQDEDEDEDEDEDVDEDEDEDGFNEKGKSRAGAPSIVEKPTDALSKTSIFNSSKNSEESTSGPSRVKPMFVVKRKSDIQPAKKRCVEPVTENNKPNDATDEIQAENGLLSLCQNYDSDSE